jgi:hypothetical protein
VKEIAVKFSKLPTPTRNHVSINGEKLELLINDMKVAGKADFFGETPEERIQDSVIKNIIRRELIASSINYCYWYGNANVRPMDSSSTSMYEEVDKALATFWDDNALKNKIHFLIGKLNLGRYPLLEERKRHLLEVLDKGEYLIEQLAVGDNDPHLMLELLVHEMNGFASDIFLKRASLFFIQLHRQLGWYKDFMNELFVPADYQVPKMLEHFGVLQYGNSLSYKIQEGKLIEKGSLMECQIRACTIVACEKIMSATGWNIADVDTWLWTKRKQPTKSFHLTITTDY